VVTNESVKKMLFKWLLKVPQKLEGGGTCHCPGALEAIVYGFNQ